jgi:hypothetical protein
MGCIASCRILAEARANEVSLFSYQSDTPAIGGIVLPCVSVHLSDYLQWMLRTFCQLSPNYLETLGTLRAPEGMRLHDRIVQFPFVAPVCRRSKLFMKIPWRAEYIIGGENSGRIGTTGRA